MGTMGHRTAELVPTFQAHMHGMAVNPSAFTVCPAKHKAVGQVGWGKAAAGLHLSCTSAVSLVVLALGCPAQTSGADSETVLNEGEG